MNPEQKEMRKIAEIEPHNRYMQIRLTEAEYEAIERKFRNSGLRSRSEFIRAMIFEGYIVNFDEEKFDKIGLTDNAPAEKGKANPYEDSPRTLFDVDYQKESDE